MFHISFYICLCMSDFNKNIWIEVQCYHDNELKLERIHYVKFPENQPQNLERETIEHLKKKEY